MSSEGTPSTPVSGTSVAITVTGGSRSDAPPDMPVVPESHQPVLRLLTRGSEQADEDEVARNPRARSVRLRAAERVREGRVA